MNNVSKPPPWQTLLAATAGGFIGAVAGVVAAGSMNGDPDDSDVQGAIKGIDPQDQKVVVAER